MKHKITKQLMLKLRNEADMYLAAKLCETCWRIFPAATNTEDMGECPNDLWGVQQAPRADVLDRQAVVKELKIIKNGLSRPCPEFAMERFQSFISKLENRVDQWK